MYTGLFDDCNYVFIGFSYVYMYMFIGIFYVRKYMYIGFLSVCRICEEKNGRQRELQRKVMKNDRLFESESTRARARERASVQRFFEYIQICLRWCVCVYVF